MKIDLEEAVNASTNRLRNHRFVRAAADAELSREQLIRWILCAGKESRAFPDVLRGALRSAKGSAHVVLKKNLDDELGNGDPNEAHFQHYLRLLDEIGVLRSVYELYEPGRDLRAALELAAKVANGTSVARLYGYLVLNESATGPIYHAMEIAAAQLFPNLQSRFFSLHVSGDEVHVRDLLTVATEFTVEHGDEVLDGIELGEHGLCLVLNESTEQSITCFGRASA
jgi:pyrroloquinoline quinone (PQQ) biosynthesis protein C